MRTLQHFATVCFLGAAAAASIAACGSSDTSTPGGAGATNHAGASAGGASGAGAGAPSAGSGAGGAANLTGNAANGAVVYKRANTGCNTCHGENAEGALGPNITSSMSAGIGSWTQAQFHTAVRESKNRKGVPLNSAMVAFAVKDISDQEIADVYAFVMSKPPSNTPVAGSFCANGGCTGSN